MDRYNKSFHAKTPAFDKHHKIYHFKTNMLGGFNRSLKIKSCRKVITKFIMVRKTVKLWIHSLVATLETHKKRAEWKQIIINTKEGP